MTSWPARRNRSRMLPPILPRPIRPSCMSGAFLGECRERGAAWSAGGARAVRGYACRSTGCTGGLARGRTTPGASPDEGGGGRAGGSAGEADRHEDVPVRAVGLAVGLLLAGQHRGAARLGERQPAEGGADGVEAVEEELRVERDLDLGSGEGGLDRLGGLGVVAGAGLDGDLTVGELQQHRGVALGDERDALDGLLEGGRLDDGLGVDARRKDRGDLGVLAVEQTGRGAALAGLETDEAVATRAEG